MRRLTDNEIMIGTLAAVQAATVYSSLMPERAHLRSMSPQDSSGVGDARHGEVMSGLIVLGLGVMISILAHSWLPIMISGLAVLGMTVAYEITIHSGVDND